MKLKLLTASAALIVATSAMADVGYQPNNAGTGNTILQNSTSNNATGGAATQGQQQSVGNSGNSSTTVGGDSYNTSRPAVATAYAPTVMIGDCLGGTSAGLQVRDFGISFGGNTKNVGCERRAYATMLFARGKERAAMAILCRDEDFKAAMVDADEECPASKKEESVATNGAPIYVSKTSAGSPDMNDQYIKSRLTGTSAFSTK